MCPVSRPELSSLIVWPGTVNQDGETWPGTMTHYDNS